MLGLVLGIIVVATVIGWTATSSDQDTHIKACMMCLEVDYKQKTESETEITVEVED